MRNIALIVSAGRSPGSGSVCPGPNVQSLRRAAGGVHEELCRTGVQDRVPDVSEILQKVRTTELIAALATAIGGWVALDTKFVAAENLRKLSGAQIRAKFV